MSETIIGLFQAVKYKALQKALLLSKELDCDVFGCLVAISVHQETKRLAGIFRIKTFEINISGT